MIIIDISQPLTILLLLAVAVLLVFLGKEVKKPQIPAVMLFVFLAPATLRAFERSIFAILSNTYQKMSTTLSTA